MSRTSVPAIPGPIPGPDLAEGVRRFNAASVGRISGTLKAAAAGMPPRFIGIVLMVAAMMLIPIVDTAAKYLSADLSPLFVAFMRYAASTALILPVAFGLRGAANMLPRNGWGMHALRTMLLVSAMSLFFVALTTVPLADALGAYFIAPIVAAVLALVILKERLTAGRIAGVVLGFAGTLLIVRPGGSMEPGLLLALLAGLLFGGYIIATRAAALRSGPLETLTFQCLFGALLLSPFAILFWEQPTAMQWGLIALMGLVSIAGHFLSITAFRFADASTLSPLVYFELVSGAALGFFIFGDIPAPIVWAGIALIVIGGLIVIRR